MAADIISPTSFESASVESASIAHDMAADSIDDSQVIDVDGIAEQQFDSANESSAESATETDPGQPTPKRKRPHGDTILNICK